jgi:hypothetical protein
VTTEICANPWITKLAAFRSELSSSQQTTMASDQGNYFFEDQIFLQNYAKQLDLSDDFDLMC